MTFFILEPSPLPIFIHLGAKYSPQDPVFKCNFQSFLNVRGHVSQPCSATGNIIISQILIFEFLEEVDWSLDWVITWISSFKLKFYFVVNTIFICRYWDKIFKVVTFSYELLHTVTCSFATMPRLCHTSMYLIFLVFSAKQRCPYKHLITHLFLLSIVLILDTYCTYIYTYIHSLTYTYVHTYIHMYIQTYIYTYRHRKYRIFV